MENPEKSGLYPKNYNKNWDVILGLRGGFEAGNAGAQVVSREIRNYFSKVKESQNSVQPQIPKLRKAISFRNTLFCPKISRDSSVFNFLPFVISSDPMSAT